MGIGLYWQAHPDLRSDEGFINLSNINAEVLFKYLVIPGAIAIIPSLLMGFYFPLVQQAVQQDSGKIGKRVGSIYLTNILGNTLGSLLTGLVLINLLGTAGSVRLLVILGIGFLLAMRPRLFKNILTTALIIISVVAAIVFPNNNRLWAAFHAEDSTSVAAIAETNGKGKLYASGQIQANFPYLLHPNPEIR